jgi:hypothetical protein
MKILLAMSSPEYLRFYDSTVIELARRGHEIVLAANAIRDGKPVRFDAIESTPGVRVAGVVPERDDVWLPVARAVRGAMDFVRYLHPDFEAADRLRARVARQALPWALQWIDRVRGLRPATVDRIMRGLAALERAIPPATALVRFVESQRPALVLVTPLVEPASDQVDLVRAAQAAGVRVGTLVASWDNLTNKGDLRVPTGFVAVWNEAQRCEAVQYHRVPPASVVVTGAQSFDRWFERRPTQSREAFCRGVGLPSDAPFVLFTGSSIFIARAEAEMPFVRRWIDALRAAPDGAARNVQVLVRPHPYNGRAWDPDAFADMPGVAVWPRGGYDPVDESSRAGFFDSLFHCAAVVGINTSAMIEASIVGRPVFAIADPQFAGSQDGTLHYRHLLPEHGGFLQVAASLDEHVTQIAAALRDPERTRGELAQFVHTFIRPHGLDVPATPLLADAITRFGESPVPAPVRATIGGALLRAMLWPLTWMTPLLLSPSEHKKYERARLAAPAATATRTVRLGMGAWLALTAAPFLSLLLLAGFAVSETLGHTPLAYRRPINIAEAAGMGRGAEVLRFLQHGADPAVVAPVHPDVISSAITRVTALEAAVWSRRVELVRMLDRYHRFDGAQRAHLACLARDIGTADVAEYLGVSNPGACEAGATMRAIEARSW